MEQGEEYISKIIVELQPRSRRGYRRLFGIRENKCLNKDLFDIDQFTQLFLNQYNKKGLRRGEHIECEKLIICVKQIKRGYSKAVENTEVEYRFRGAPLKSKKNDEGKLNESFIDDVLNKKRQSTIDIQFEQTYSCYCSECKKCLSNGDFYIKSGNWSRPILCLSCYDLLFTYKCVRCTKSITFDRKETNWIFRKRKEAKYFSLDDSLTSDGLGRIRFVENNGLYWHSDCCVCITCLDSLIGRRFYQDQIFNQLFCLDHIPNQYL